MFQMDLSGEWQVRMITAEGTEVYAGGINLPSTTSASMLGVRNENREENHLTDLYPFTGTAEYTRTVRIPEHGKRLCALTLERTRLTEVFWDGVSLGTRDSLMTPHRYMIPDAAPGKHRLTVRVTNAGYPTPGGHMTSPDTQTNWNGITGEISLRFADTMISAVRILPDPAYNRIRVRAEVTGDPEGSLRAAAEGYDEQALPWKDGQLDAWYSPKDTLPLWDEYDPRVMRLTLRTETDSYDVTFGMRKVTTADRKMLNNGREMYLRGSHDGLLFPQTGYTPTSDEEWTRHLKTYQEYGFTHVRFHTCCPPDAAFAAADKLGIWLEPELPFWGTVHTEGEKEYNAAESEYLIREGYRVLEEYGHHPSFIMLSLGNELWGSREKLNEMLRNYRTYDPDKLYLSGSNNFQFAAYPLEEEDIFSGVRLGEHRLLRGSYAMCDAPQGAVQLTAPESRSDFDSAVLPARDAVSAGKRGELLIQRGTGVQKVQAAESAEAVCDIPIITHETGQYACYPDFEEETLYTGPLQPRYLRIYRERLEKAGLYDQHDRFFRSAGKLAADCYKREIEAALRSQEISGFQLLDLKDYTGQCVALVGMLNSLMENKGLIRAEEWRSFCSDTAVLGLLDTFVYRAGERVTLGVRVSASHPQHRPHTVSCQLMRGSEILQRQETSLSGSGRLLTGGEVPFSLPQTNTAGKLQIRLETDTGETNQYPIWVFPQANIQITREGISCQGKTIPFSNAPQKGSIYIPPCEGMPEAAYCTDFWNYPMFAGISRSAGKPLPDGTLGLCIDVQDALLADFPADDYTTPVWYPILKKAHVQPISTADAPVQMIDNVLRCQRLGILYRENGCVCLTARLWEASDDPCVRALAYSLWKGMHNAGINSGLNER